MDDIYLTTTLFIPYPLVFFTLPNFSNAIDGWKGKDHYYGESLKHSWWIQDLCFMKRTCEQFQAILHAQLHLRTSLSLMIVSTIIFGCLA
jgi:hypothetical protein